MEPYKVLKYPLATEKAVRIMEIENKLVFRVEEKANKKEIKEAVEQMFNVKVIKVTTLHDKKGKKAYITLSIDTPAIDIATQLGLI